MKKNKLTEQELELFSQNKKKYEKETDLSFLLSSEPEEIDVVSLDGTKEDAAKQTVDLEKDEYSNIENELLSNAYQNDTQKKQIVVQEEEAKEPKPINETMKQLQRDDDPIFNVVENHEEQTAKKVKKPFPFKVVFASLGFILVIGAIFVVSNFLSSTATPTKEIIAFTTDKIVINYGDEITVDKYIKNAKEYSDIKVENIDKESLSVQLANVTATKNGAQAKGQINIEIKDVEGPTFELTTDAVHIKRDEIDDFECINYVDTESFADNHDNMTQLSFITACPSLKDLSPGSNGAIIKYKLTDISGNSTVKNLTVIIDD